MKHQERENPNYNSIQECSVGMKAEMYRTVIAVAFILLVFMVLGNFDTQLFVRDHKRRSVQTLEKYLQFR